MLSEKRKQNKQTKKTIGEKVKPVESGGQQIETETVSLTAGGAREASLCPDRQSLHIGRFRFAAEEEG